MRIVRNVLILVVVIVGIVVIGIALTCNGDSDEDDDAQEPIGTPAEGSEDLDATVNELLVIFRQGDAAALRRHLGAELAGQVDDAALGELAGCVPEGVVIEEVGRSPEALSDEATVTLEFEVTDAAGETVPVTAVWNFEQAEDGAWLLRALPPCPTESG
jgi:hypothetical protein